MSGSTLPGRHLRWRMGMAPVLRPQPVPVGSTVTIIFELIDNVTGEIVDAEGLGAIGRRPELGGYADYSYPLSPARLGVGTWRVASRTDMTGPLVIQATTFGDDAPVTCDAIIPIVPMEAP